MKKLRLLPIWVTVILSAIAINGWAMPDASNDIGYITGWSWTCDGTNTVKAQFRLPVKSYVGNTSYAGRQMYWSVVQRHSSTDIDTLAKGTGTAGDTIRLTLTPTRFTNPRVSFYVTAGVTDNPSDSKTIERNAYVGGGAPHQPQNVTARLADDGKTVHLTWEKPKAGSTDVAAGGTAYVNLDSIYYMILRLPGYDTVAVNVDALEYTDVLPDTTYLNYSYQVYAYFRGKKSVYSGNSNEFGAGPAYTVPFNWRFTSANNKLFTSIDGNGDRRQWYLSGTNGGMTISNNYNGKDGNDWLLSPPIHMQKGNVYKFSTSAYNYYDGNKGTIDIMLAAHSDTADIQRDNVPVITAEVTSSTWKKFTKEFSVPATGNYRIAYHDVSKITSYQVTIDSVDVTLVSQIAAPDSVTSLKAVRGARGAQTVDLSFLAPAIRTDSTALAGLDSIVVVRGNDSTTVARLTSVEPGKAYSVTDRSALTGFNTYYIYAYNEAGIGRGSSVRTPFVGQDVPKAPENVHMQDLDQTGNVALTWAPVDSVGANGGYVNTAEVVYGIYPNNDSTATIADSLKSTTFSYKVPIADPSTQDIYKMRVVARNAAGTGPEAQSNVVIFGTPYDMPFHEDWYSIGDNLWWFRYEGAKGYASGWKRSAGSADYDGFCMAIRHWNAGDATQLNSGKINVQGANDPVLDYWYNPNPGTFGKMIVRISRESKDVVVVDSIDYLTDKSRYGQWTHRVIDLKPYLTDEKYIYVSFRPVAEADYDDGNNSLSPAFAIDAITVSDMKAHDVKAEIKAPTAAKVSSSAIFNVTVTNLSSDGANGYTVNLYVNGQKADSVAGTALTKQLEEKTYQMRYTPSAADTLLSAYAVVDYADDANTADNTSATVTAKVEKGLLATVDDLSAATNGGKTTLSWTEPSKAKAQTVTDNFESYNAWDLDGFGDWKVYDGDKLPTLQVGLELWPTYGEPFAFQIYNESDVHERVSNNKGSIETPHSGTQSVMNLAVATGTDGANDDWLISPELSGNAQTVDMWIKTYSSQGAKGSTIAFTTSKTGTDISDFKALKGDTVNVLSQGVSNWTHVTVDSTTITEGTKYLALHVISDHASWLFIDDVTYQPAVKAVRGYNVYEDGKLIGTTDGTTTFALSSDGESHDYNVTVVYDNGESSFSNTATIVTTGISTVSGSATKNPVEYYTTGGVRLAKPQRGVNIVRMSDGTTRKVVIK